MTIYRALHATTGKEVLIHSDQAADSFETYDNGTIRLVDSADLHWWCITDTLHTVTAAEMATLIRAAHEKADLARADLTHAEAALREQQEALDSASRIVNLADQAHDDALGLVAWYQDALDAEQG